MPCCGVVRYILCVDIGVCAGSSGYNTDAPTACAVMGVCLYPQVWTTVPKQVSWSTPYLSVQGPIDNKLQRTEDGEESCCVSLRGRGGVMWKWVQQWSHH